MTESKLPSRNRQRFQFTETSDKEISTSPSFMDNFFELNPVDNLSSKELICTGPVLNDLIIRWFESSQYRKPINNPKAKKDPYKIDLDRFLNFMIEVLLVAKQYTLA